MRYIGLLPHHILTKKSLTLSCWEINTTGTTIRQLRSYTQARSLLNRVSLANRPLESPSVFKMDPMAPPDGNRALPPMKHFYRKVLPQSCISFSSEDGKKFFKAAILEGNMECYFKLAAQFRTQDEPAFCGLSTMVMVLNALDIDPGRIWKGVWRWYHENMLDCCVPLEVVQQQGINFDQFVCGARCNSLDVEPTRMEEGVMSVEEFRELIRNYTKRDDAFVVLSYSRRTLDQSGEGHFSPVGGYHPGKDLVLILDTARFKYPPHWVPLDLIYKAMKEIDQDTGKPRGLMVMSRKKESHPLLLFRLSSNMSVTARVLFNPAVPEFMMKLKTQTDRTLEETLSVDALADRAARDMIQVLAEISGHVTIMTTQLDITCPQDVAEKHECFIQHLIKALQETVIFEKVTNICKSLPEDKMEVMENLFEPAWPSCNGKCQPFNKLKCEHFITFFILTWPYRTGVSGETTLAALYDQMVEDELQRISVDVLSMEVKSLKDQLHVLMEFYQNNPKGPEPCCKKIKL
ncbi:glutathione gamma-glutamylcysteinyltransferase 2-like [Haliotis rufescens]|uniref:glutathione gamma-glutamylcysteinyltransferase 2-like n=1 Tax=Haliotis rufescens TaxID=6454 RepID=UPI00201E9283|nr:glutathione gamma-glutamylcysteinyltransferase 2-like [Haliotis rufescens]